MNDFNKTDTDLSPTRNKRYHSIVWKLSHNGHFNTRRDKELTDYINTYASQGFILDSITMIVNAHVLIVFVKN